MQTTLTTDTPRSVPGLATPGPASADLAGPRFRAMGSDAHVVVNGDPALVDWARLRVTQLEDRWSRFLAHSEISRLNASAGAWVSVSDDTLLLVERAVEAWRLTGGRFDPTVLGDVVRAGYDASYDELPAHRTSDELRRSTAAGVRAIFLGCDDIESSGRRLRLPPGVGFDPGGVGKGLAADLVVAELLARGADGACVNLGGDVRVAGSGPNPDGGWTIAIEHPWNDEPLALLGLADGAVATSTTLRRTWTVGGEERHHVIDPNTGRPSETDLTAASVVAGSAWLAEVLAKAVLLRGSEHPFDVVEGNDAAALVVDRHGLVTGSDALAPFLGGQPLPQFVDGGLAVGVDLIGFPVERKVPVAS